VRRRPQANVICYGTSTTALTGPTEMAGIDL